MLQQEARASGRSLWIAFGREDADALAVSSDAGDETQASSWSLPLDHLGERVGLLCLARAADETLADLEPLVEAAAALASLAVQQQQAPAARAANHANVRAALRGAGTFVWEWQIGSDLLPDIDEGFAMLGYPKGHFAPTQVHWDRLIHPEDLRSNDEAYLRHARGEAENYVSTYRALDVQGQWRWLEERGRIVERDASGKPLRVLGTQSDVTHQRQLEVETAIAEAASRAKTEFLSRMSHELRTPLNAVLGFAQLLELAREPRLAEPHRRHVRLIRDAGEHLLAMIGDLLDLTRIESGQVALTLERIPLATLAEECLALVQAQAAAAGVVLTNALKTAPSTPTVRADRTRLKQVVINLLSNAIKYNRAGGTVTISGASEGAMARLAVIDTGVGIAPEHQARLFEPFQRGAHAHGTIEGTGIGLAVSRSLVELMGGRVDAQSQAGAGSTFSVWLPA